MSCSSVADHSHSHRTCAGPSVNTFGNASVSRRPSRASSTTSTASSPGSSAPAHADRSLQQPVTRELPAWRGGASRRSSSRRSCHTVRSRHKGHSRCKGHSRHSRRSRLSRCNRRSRRRKWRWSCWFACSTDKTESTPPTQLARNRPSGRCSKRTKSSWLSCRAACAEKRAPRQRQSLAWLVDTQPRLQQPGTTFLEVLLVRCQRAIVGTHLCAPSLQVCELLRQDLAELQCNTLTHAVARPSQAPADSAFSGPWSSPAGTVSQGQWVSKLRATGKGSPHNPTRPAPVCLRNVNLLPRLLRRCLRQTSAQARQTDLHKSRRLQTLRETFGRSVQEIPKTLWKP